MPRSVPVTQKNGDHKHTDCCRASTEYEWSSSANFVDNESEKKRANQCTSVDFVADHKISF